MKTKSRFFVYGSHILLWSVVLLLFALAPEGQRQIAITAWCFLFGGGFLLIVYWCNRRGREPEK